MEVTVNVIVKVINLDYGFLESRKQVTRINLLNSQILFEVRVGEGKGWGMLVWCGDMLGLGRVSGGMIIRDPCFRDPRIRD